MDGLLKGANKQPHTAKGGDGATGAGLEFRLLYSGLWHGVVSLSGYRYFEGTCCFPWRRSWSRQRDSPKLWQYLQKCTENNVNCPTGLKSSNLIGYRNFCRIRCIQLQSQQVQCLLAYLQKMFSVDWYEYFWKMNLEECGLDKVWHCLRHFSRETEESHSNAQAG